MKYKTNTKHVSNEPTDNLVQLVLFLEEINRKMKLNPELYKLRELGSPIVVVNGFGQKVTL
jgi:hypothetical protein